MISDELERLWNHLCSNPNIVVFGWQDWEEHGTPIRVASVLAEILTRHFPNTSVGLM
jgi:hypothetical protein